MNQRKFLPGLALAVVAGLLVSAAAQAQWTWTPQTKRWVNVKRMPKETAELQYEYARQLMTEGKYKKALEETKKFADFYEESDFGDDVQFLRGEIMMADEDYLAASKEFQQVVKNYPNTDLFDKVIKKQYEIGDALYAKGEKNLQKRWRPWRTKPFKQAIDVYNMVIDNQPFTPAAAEAQYKVGLCHFMRKEYKEAAAEYRRVIEDYAGSDWVDEASQGLAMAYYKSSLPPNYDQAPSQLTINAVDDFKERYPGDERISDLDAKRVEMRTNIAEQRLRTAQFYEKRRKFDSARTYYQVVADQFAETPAADKARAWLSAHPTTGVKAAS